MEHILLNKEYKKLRISLFIESVYIVKYLNVLNTTKNFSCGNKNTYNRSRQEILKKWTS